ncbi:MAG: TatD family hydrolase [Chitinophagaceae bacterium]|nr:TatD family hydrolase [Chitinophagaceae bacterium]
MFIDTHSHMYAEEFDLDRNEIIKKAIEVGVKKIVLPNCNSETVGVMLALEKQFPENCFSMMGLHPCYVKENVEEELALVEKLLNEKKFIAVGEIGLDFYWDTSFKEEQINAFQFQIDLAKKHKLPIAIHTRNAMAETIELIEKNKDENLRGVFHCFSGTLEDAKKIISLGFYLGIGGVITYKNSGLQEILKEIDLQHILLETDAPYLSPVPFRGKRNESAYIPFIAEKLSEIKDCSLNTIKEQTTENAISLFGII